MDIARKEAKAFRLAFLGTLEQELHPHADAQRGWVRRRNEPVEAVLAQLRHARRAAPTPGSTTWRGVADGIPVRGDRGVDAKPENAAWTEPRLAPPESRRTTRAVQSAPLVLGSSCPSRRRACRSARATDLKQASIM